MFLSDSDILALMKSSQLGIHPFRQEQLTPNGYDLRIAPTGDVRAAHEVVGELVLAPDGFAKVKTQETIYIGNGYVAFMLLRSRYSRNGLMGNFAVIDSGFRGVIHASLKNVSDTDIAIKLDEGVIHLVVARLTSKSMHPYGSDAHSHFQNQQ